VKKILLFFIGISLLSGLSAQTAIEIDSSITAASLFQTEDALEVVLRTDINTLFRDREDERSYHPGTIMYKNTSGEDIEVPLKLRVRGNFRRKSGVCRIPPIRLNFARETSKGTIFQGQDKLKLVTHFQKAPVKYMQYLLQEYLVYKMFNLVSDYGFKVRLLKITYEDEAGKWKPMDSYAFIIEDEDAMAKRYETTINEKKGHHPLAKRFNVHSTTLLSVFEYCIGNTDWSVPGLHNVKLLDKGPEKDIIPVPYDFDWCGMVNAPYAVPNEILGLPNVRTRLYRGYERDPEVFDEVFAKFRDNKEAIYALYETCPGLIKQQKKQSKNYLDGFYRIIENPKLSKLNIKNAARDAD